MLLNYVLNLQHLGWKLSWTAFTLWMSLRVLKWRRQRNLGSKACAVPSKVPFGLDVLVTAINRLRKDTFIEWTRGILDVPGHTVELRALGIELIITDNPDNIKAVLSTKFSSFGKGKKFHAMWYDLMLNSIFSTDGQLWHENKNYLREHTAKIRPSDYTITEKHVQNLLKTLCDGAPHDCLDQVDRFSMDTVTEVFFGESAGTLCTSEQPIRDAIEEMYTSNTRKHLLGNVGPLLPHNKRASGVVDNYLTRVISKFETEPTINLEEKSRKESTLLSSMLSSQAPIERTKDQMMAIILGGKDPTSITITWALYEIARNPPIAKKLRTEISSVLGLNEQLQPHHLKNMPYLHKVFQETLRLYIPLGFNARTALIDTVLPTGGGRSGEEPLCVLKGTHILMANACLQRRFDLVGPDADDFNPDRWDSWKPEIWEFLPFNHGPRICLGKNFAEMQTKYVLVRLLQEFGTLQVVDEIGNKISGNEVVKIRVALNTKPAHPIMLRFLE